MKVDYEVLINEKQLDKNDNILDLGSGDGRNSIFFLRRGYPVTVCDINSNQLRKLLLNCIQYGERLRIYNCELERLIYLLEHRTFKFIILSQVMNFFDLTTIEEICTQIKKLVTIDGMVYFKFYEDLYWEGFKTYTIANIIQNQYHDWIKVSYEEYSINKGRGISVVYRNNM